MKAQFVFENIRFERGVSGLRATESGIIGEAISKLKEKGAKDFELRYRYDSGTPQHLSLDFILNDYHFKAWHLIIKNLKAIEGLNDLLQISKYQLYRDQFIIPIRPRARQIFVDYFGEPTK